MGCFVLEGFVLTSSLCGSSAITELLVLKYESLNILHVWLGNDYSCPPNWVFKQFDPINGEQCQYNLQKTHSCIENTSYDV